MNCDRIAGAYRWCEYLRYGKTLERCRFSMVPHLIHSRHALILGEGDGRFLNALLAANPNILVHAVEASEGMIDRARERLDREQPEASRRVIFVKADARTWSVPEYPFDLIVTHFFFDVFPEKELAMLIPRVAARASRDALWVVSEFDKCDGHIRRLWSRLWLRTMYLFFRCVTGLQNQALADWRTPLRRAGFEREAARRWEGGFIVSEVWRRSS